MQALEVLLLVINDLASAFAEAEPLNFGTCFSSFQKNAIKHALAHSAMNSDLREPLFAKNFIITTKKNSTHAKKIMIQYI